jgi:FkbM family methyltransferase
LRLSFWDNKRFQVVEAAITSHSGNAELFSVHPEASQFVGRDLPNYYRGIASLDRSNVEKHLPEDIRPHVISSVVPSMTWDELVEHYSVSRLDLLHIDAEGHDYEILRQIDLNKYQPAVILIEHKHLSRTERGAAEKQLEAAQYEVEIYDSDLFAVKNLP